MFQSKYKLCELFGIPVYVDLSFAILLFLFATSEGSFSFGLASALVLAISVVLHELGHALTAGAFGFRTRDITLSLLGGCASLIALPRKGWQEFLTALAGPLVSFALAAAGWFSFAVFNIENAWLAFALSYLCWLNLMLGAFNLLPGFPLDGGRIFRSVLLVFFNRSKATFIAMWVGRVFAILLGISGLHAIVSGGSWGFIRILIAWMIWQEGYREYLLAIMESSWDYRDFRARVSPPPYGGRGDDCDVTKN
jgi:Zn-dependent protease